MKKILPLALAGLVILTGCAHGYVMTLSSGERIHTTAKPKLVNGFYYFTDATGHDSRPVFSGSVREIAPSGMESPDPSSMFKNVSTK
jgi:hypothetical protein